MFLFTIVDEGKNMVSGGGGRIFCPYKGTQSAQKFCHAFRKVASSFFGLSFRPRTTLLRPKTSGFSKSPIWFFLDIRIRFVLLPTFGILGTEICFFENSLLVFRGPKSQTCPAKLRGTTVRKYQKLLKKEKLHCFRFLVLLPKHHYQTEFVIHSSKSSFFDFVTKTTQSFRLARAEGKASEIPKLNQPKNQCVLVFEDPNTKMIWYSESKIPN